MPSWKNESQTLRILSGFRKRPSSRLQAVVISVIVQLEKETSRLAGFLIRFLYFIIRNLDQKLEQSIVVLVAHLRCRFSD